MAAQPRRYGECARTIRQGSAALFKAAPEPMRAAQSSTAAAANEGARPIRIKERMAVATAIANCCEGGVVPHVAAARRHGVARDEVHATISAGVEMGGEPAAVNDAAAFAAYHQEEIR